MTLQTVHCKSIDDAAGILNGNARARLLAGGTLVMRAVNEGDQSFDTLVRLSDPAWRNIRVDAEHLTIGAGATMSDVLASRDARALHAAARLVGGPAIRNMATVGGNLFAAAPYGDLATALLALDAQVFCVGEATPRPIESLFATRQRPDVYGRPGGVAVRTNPNDPGARISAIVAGPLVREIRCRRPSSPGDFRFLKVSRVKPKGVSVIAIAAHLPGASSGARLSDVRVAFGAMAISPVRAAAVEQALEGQSLDVTTIAAACARALDGLDPPGDPIASGWYRATVAPVHLGRLLRGEHGSR